LSKVQRPTKHIIGHIGDGNRKRDRQSPDNTQLVSCGRRKLVSPFVP